MPTVTQFGLIQLAQPSSIADLEGNKDYVKAIQTIRAQPGCIRTGWGIPEGKPQQLVWLHGESRMAKDLMAVEWI